MSDVTPRLGLPWLMPAQAQKHVTINESLGRLDALIQCAVQSRTATGQPASPGEGQAWILPAGASGADWDGFFEHDIAYVQDGAWRRIAARAGLTAWIEDEAALVLFDGTGWSAFTDAITALSNLTELGVGTSPDANNPFAAKLNAALWTARTAGEGGTGDLRYTLNKEGPANVLSLLLQSAWSGRAEIGLTGSDDLSVKVSADGSVWSEALSINRADGAVTLPEAVISGGAATGLSALGLAAGGALAFGSEPEHMVRRADLGSAAFLDGEAIRLTPVRTISAADDIAPDDLGRLIVQTGPGTVTLPPGAFLDPGWRVQVKNRSGAAIDLAPGDLSETIDAGAAGAAISLPDGQARLVIHAGGGAWESV